MSYDDDYESLDYTWLEEQEYEDVTEERADQHDECCKNFIREFLKKEPEEPEKPDERHEAFIQHRENHLEEDKANVAISVAKRAESDIKQILQEVIVKLGHLTKLSRQEFVEEHLQKIEEAIQKATCGVKSAEEERIKAKPQEGRAQEQRAFAMWGAKCASIEAEIALDQAMASQKTLNQFVSEIQRARP